MPYLYKSILKGNDNLRKVAPRTFPKRNNPERNNPNLFSGIYVKIPNVNIPN
jgi:hypothetical protein